MIFFNLTSHSLTLSELNTALIFVALPTNNMCVHLYLRCCIALSVSMQLSILWTYPPDGALLQ